MQPKLKVVISHLQDPEYDSKDFLDSDDVVDDDASAVQTESNRPKTDKDNETIVADVDQSEVTKKPQARKSADSKAFTTKHLAIGLAVVSVVSMFALRDIIINSYANWKEEVSFFPPQTEGLVKSPDWARKLDEIQSKMNESLSQQQGVITSLRSQLAGYESRLALLAKAKAQINGNQPELKTLHAQYANVLNEIEGFKGILHSTTQQSGNHSNSRVDSLESRLDTYVSQIGSIHDRLNGLERNTQTLQSDYTTLAQQQSELKTKQELMTTSARITDEKRSRAKASSQWRLKSASAKIAFVKNVVTGQSLRISTKSSIPGCGAVKSIDASRQVVTTQACGSIGR